MSIICTAIFAKPCIPFEDFAFDKWVSYIALAKNIEIHVSKPLVLFQRHENNVSGIFNGVNCKQDYYLTRVENHHKLVNELRRRYPGLDLLLECTNRKNPFALLKYK